jgi:hypothetical protein
MILNEVAVASSKVLNQHSPGEGLNRENPIRPVVTMDINAASQCTVRQCFSIRLRKTD